MLICYTTYPTKYAPGLLYLFSLYLSSVCILVMYLPLSLRVALLVVGCHALNTSRFRRHNGWHFADDIFNCIFLNINIWISINISLNFFPKGQINYIPALVHIMAWRWPGDKPLSEPMMVILPTHMSLGLNDLTLYVLNFHRNHKNVSTIYIIPPHRHDTGSWNLTSCTAGTYLFHVVSIMGCPGDARSQGVNNNDTDFVDLG